MTRQEIKDLVEHISYMLDTDPPTIEYSTHWQGVFLEAGLHQGWETVVFNPDFIESASDILILVTVAHEVRHTYQMVQIKRALDEMPVDNEHVIDWAIDMTNGKGDSPQDSKEVDAEIFSHIFVSGLCNAGFDIIKMIDPDEMREIFEDMKNEPWFDETFEDIIFYEKTSHIFIGQKDFLKESLKK